ncbi:hypothetical protein J3E64_004110 [Sphingobium sp. OAS761]|nr:hypothetical protein [Sphingobium sp. OAS761]
MQFAWLEREPPLTWAKAGLASFPTLRNVADP